MNDWPLITVGSGPSAWGWSCVIMILSVNSVKWLLRWMLLYVGMYCMCVCLYVCVCRGWTHYCHTSCPIWCDYVRLLSGTDLWSTDWTIQWKDKTVVPTWVPRFMFYIHTSSLSRQCPWREAHCAQLFAFWVWKFAFFWHVITLCSEHRFFQWFEWE